MCECEKRDFHRDEAQEYLNRIKSAQIAAEETGQVYADAAAHIYSPKAATPIDLLRELRAGFEAEGRHFRERASYTPDRVEEQVCGAKAFAAESAVKRIDATLRDWG